MSFAIETRSTAWLLGVLGLAFLVRQPTPAEVDAPPAMIELELSDHAAQISGDVIVPPPTMDGVIHPSFHCDDGVFLTLDRIVSISRAFDTVAIIAPPHAL